MKHNQAEIPDGIAIIGMSGRFPGARSIEQFWQNLRNGVESISTFTAEDLALSGTPATALQEPGFVAAGGVLEGIDKWDAQFFGMNARDAEIMDPQQRLFLECAWESLENAGYTADQYEGAIGVYGGMSMSTYIFQIYANADRIAHLDQMQVLLLNDKDHLTTHVSYKLNLTGPSLVIQSACSTSLVAICTACDGLWNHRCDMALAGGVAISVPQRKGYMYQPGGILSPDGHCRAFDANAQGTLAGNGVALVVLKRLSEAVADRDHIYAVIRGAAVNNDGSFKVGYTAPSVVGQANVISMAQAMGGIDPSTVTYVEAHGTGTQLGDPIEVAALTEAFRVGSDKNGFCAIGSAKTNLGHLDPAAGVTGLIKTALALHHREVPPSLHFEKPNPEIDFENSPFYVNTELRPWLSDGTPLRAGVSSFGIGGTNAHCVLEEAPLVEASSDTRPYQLLLLSAKTRSALDAQTVSIAKYLREHPDTSLADVAYVLQVGRKHFVHRQCLVCPSGDVSGTAVALEQPDSPSLYTNSGDAKIRPVMFLFPGQGVQYVGMAAGLYETEPTFRAQLDECCDVLVGHLGLDLRDQLFPSDGARAEANVQLRRTALTQPALFAIEYSLAVLFLEWGVIPQAMVGHSIGEYVAACLAGVFSLEDALLLVSQRGRLMDSMPRGAMLAVPLSEEEARAAMGDNLSLAAVNGPSACVISGPIDEIENIERRFATRGLACKRLATSHAFHSSMMDGAVAQFVDVVRSVSLAAPSIPYLSNVTGSWMTVEDATDPEYYGRQLRDTVRYADGLQMLLKQPEWVYLEVGPGHTLGSLLRQQSADASKRVIISSLPASTESKGDVAFTLESLGRLWITGIPVLWKVFSAHEARRRIPLPTYPFERERYWIGPPDSVEAREFGPARANRRALADWFYVPMWSPVQSAAVHTQAAPNPAENWLVFMDECGIGGEISRKLAAQGHTVITVRPGEHFEQISDTEYSLVVNHPQSYDRLIDELASANLFPRRILHLWLVTFIQEGDFETLQDYGFRSLLYLSQALGKQRSSDDVELTIVSNGMQAVRESDPLSPAKATALGPCRVIAQEYPNVSTRSIDIEADADIAESARHILDEVAFEPAWGPVAYREQTRWLQSFEPVRLEDAKQPDVLRTEGGVYLITGGLGGIGLAIASQLAKSPNTKLILLGRSPLSKADDRTLKAIKALETSGAEVLIASADVTDRAAMQRVLAEATQRFGAIHGVVHSAGIAGGGMIQLKTLEVAASVFAPKVQGTLVLHDLLNDTELDFFVICSSLAAVYGGFGQVDYCAANNFLDAYASAHSSPERPIISINWDTWRDVGMAVNTEVPPEMRQAREDSLAKGIAPLEGAQAFLRILQAGVPQIAVCTTDLQASLSMAVSTGNSEPTQPVESVSPVRSTHDRPALPNAYVAARSETEEALAGIWQDLLGVSSVGIHDNFFELGGHSLLAIQVISQIRTVFQVEISIQDLFDAPTVAQLAERVAAAAEDMGDLETIAHLLEQVEQLSDAEVTALLNGKEADAAAASSGRKQHAG